MTPVRDRVVSAVAAAATVALIGVGLVYGLAMPVVPRQVSDALAVLNLAPPPPPPPRVVEPPKPSRAAKKAPAPPNLRNKASEVVVPPPVIRTPPPPHTVVAAPVAGPGFAANAGASDRPGPGIGAGGEGNGTGGGGDGDGGDDRGPEQVKGRLDFGDLPPAFRETGADLDVGVEFTVNVDGRVSGCRTPQSSGHPDADAAVCRAIERKFRFLPSRDPAGRPVRSIVVERHHFAIDRSQM